MRGQTPNMPSNAAGTVGVPRCTARIAAPFLNFFTSPSIERFTLREEDKDFATSQTKSAGLHCTNQVRIRIHGNNMHQARSGAPERRGEVLAGSYEEDITHRAEGERAHEQERVEIALVIRAKRNGPRTGMCSRPVT